MSNGCPVCTGLGRVMAFGMNGEATSLLCPECAGLSITPASADERPRDERALRTYSAREITAFMLGRPALPSGRRLEAVELVDQGPEAAVRRAVEP